jgi:hypothetical protein
MSEQRDWLEAAREAFLWRYFYDDCNGSRSSSGDLVRSDVRLVGSLCGVGVRKKEFGSTN